jgi:hypothetical protein
MIPITVMPVNDAPVLTAPVSLGVVEDEASPLSGIAVADVDATTLQLTLAAAAGTMSATAHASVSITGSGTATVVVSGATTALNTYLGGANVFYVTAPDANGATALVATLDDLGNSGTGGALTDQKSVALNIEARLDADLALALDNTDDYLLGGETTHYQLFVRNSGGDAVAGNALAFVTSGNLGNLVWACVATAPATCPAAAGNGAPSFTGLALPAGGVLLFQIDADVAADPEIGAVANGTLTPPATLQDPSPGDHAATHTALVGLFRDGFQ